MLALRPAGIDRASASRGASALSLEGVRFSHGIATNDRLLPRLAAPESSVRALPEGGETLARAYSRARRGAAAHRLLAAVSVQ